MPSPAPNPAPPEAEPRSRGLLVLLSTVVLLWAVLGYGSTRNYFDSEATLMADRERLHAFGAGATVEQCLDEVLRWRPTCRALDGLCSASVDRMMGACLAGQDRVGYCASLGEGVDHRQLGVADCRARGFERRSSDDKVCGKSWAAVAAHCKALPGQSP